MEVPEGLIGFVAVLTLPVGILMGWTVGFDVAAVVFVVGWLALVPGPGVLREWLGEDDDLAARGGGRGNGAPGGPPGDAARAVRPR